MTGSPMAREMEHIANVTLDERSIVHWSPAVAHERKVAIFDLLEANHFAPKGLAAGPYDLHLSIAEGRLLFDIVSAEKGKGATGEGEAKTCIALSVRGFRKLIQDYFTVCDSYYAAIKKSATASQIEAIDMGRRGLHDEGAELLRERLADKIGLDENTARRLFTLVCVLHLRA